MAKVRYIGTMDHEHKSNPTRTAYMFHVGVFTEVKPEDAVFYAERAKHGSPWEVEIGIVEKATDIIRDATEVLGKDKEETKSRSKWKSGGKK